MCYNQTLLYHVLMHTNLIGIYFKGGCKMGPCFIGPFYQRPDLTPEILVWIQ
jgi:hypothetical protein